MWKVWKGGEMSLRDEMPDTAAFVDAMRAAFGADAIDASIRAGIKGETTFVATEAGRTVGTPGTVPADGRLHVFTEEEFDDVRARG